MFHYFDSVRNVHGEVLTGFFVRAVKTVTNTGATLYSDNSLTPIATVSGVADAAQVDGEGNVSFYITSGSYHLDYYAPDGVTFVKRIQNVPMVELVPPVFCQVTGTSTQSIPNITLTSIAWDTNYLDPLNLHSTSSNATRIVIPITGYYRVKSEIQFDANSTGFRLVFIKATTSGNIGPAQARSTNAVNGSFTNMQCEEELFLSAGDYVETGVQQTSGAALNVNLNKSYMLVQLVRGV
jgi:hypothetical protein